MKERIIRWGIAKLLGFVDADTVEEIYKEQINLLIFKLYKNNISPYLLDREISAMVFNAKYSEEVKSLGIETEPSKLLTQFYNMANKGDTSFMKDPFYRLLAQMKDSEIRKLRYRIKRNQ